MEITVGHEKLDDVLQDPLVLGLLEAVSDGALVIDASDRRVAAMNHIARKLLGYEQEEVMGCQCRKMMNSPACSLACPLTAHLEGREKETELELYYRGREGNRVLHAHTRMVLVRGRSGEPLAGIELFRDLQEVQQLKRALGERVALHGIIGKSRSMQGLFETIEQVAPYDLPVLITGESGVGKERFADAVHYHSKRAEGAYLKINCASLSPSLVESELFGHCRGAFTGAASDHRGFFERADGGTLFLDEVGELPANVQAKLLRVLQEGEVQRLGDERLRKVDVRILAATNRDLEDEVAVRNFREDLYYRLLGVRLNVPPLRERVTDIPALAHHFLAKFSGELKAIKPLRISDQAMAMLLEREWPGNVRELENVLRLASIRALSQGCLEPKHISPPVREKRREPVAPVGTLADLEREAISAAMARMDGNMAAAARVLGIDRSTLWRKIKKLNPDQPFEV